MAGCHLFSGNQVINATHQGSLAATGGEFERFDSIWAK